MQRDALVAVIVVMVIAAIAVILFLLPSEPALAEITAVTTDKDLYHSNEVMKIAISVNSSRNMDNTIVRIEGIRDRRGVMRLSHEMPANHVPLPAVFTYDYQLPQCSACAGLNPGAYKVNVTLVQNGKIISNMTHSVQIKQ